METMHGNERGVTDTVLNARKVGVISRKRQRKAWKGSDRWVVHDRSLLNFQESAAVDGQFGVVGSAAN